MKLTSEHSEYVKSKTEFTEYLRDRGYSKECIEEAFCKVEKLDRIRITFLFLLILRIILGGK